MVGTDPGVLHFGIAPAKGRYLAWQVEQEVEAVRLDLGVGQPVTLELARSATALRRYSLDGMPVDVSRLALDSAFDGRRVQVAGDGGALQVRLWRPAPGVYARATVRASDDAGLRAVAGALRLTEARRCGGPLRLSSLPAGAHVTACAVDASTFPNLLTARFTITGPAEERMGVTYRYAVGLADSPRKGDTAINGRPAVRYALGDLKRLELLGFPKARLTAEYGWPTPGFTELDAAAVLAGAQVAGDPTRPETWG
ncbi:hypothetical protein MRQ36_07270 [Micromonospora sp. R77]|uniref:hypothetical protein n=1 Tax=Micromonospora sp. R77 TaxID=2925836 RepID=UPI001F625A89|nr:hypothetical protein [Micromonospora sp. R77]MCI4062372.1 hypothetical protein [Micromonospora sp. R77]